jgi:hypothetical protein
MCWFEQMAEIQLQKNKRVPALEVVKHAMGNLFRRSTSGPDCAF